jgi:late competence protein required for DNA uptake (superfamily II DNA/RNA helicase)
MRNPIFLDPEITKCICPRCRKIHYKLMKWSGRGIARIYCNECMKLDLISGEIIYPEPIREDKQLQ